MGLARKWTDYKREAAQTNRWFARRIQPICTARVSAFQSDKDRESQTELDSHADTCVLGKHALITHDFERPVNVTGYDKSAGSRMFKTVSGALGYMHEGEIHLLHVQQAIYMPELEHNLLCPMQLRLNDVQVNDVPKFLVDHPTADDHAITILREDENPLIIPLDLDGVTSYFPTFKPTVRQFEEAEENGNLHTLTYDAPDWDPSSADFARRELTMVDHRGQVYGERTKGSRSIFGVGSASAALLKDELLEALRSRRHVLRVRSAPKAADRGLCDGHVGFVAPAVASQPQENSDGLTVEEMSTARASAIDPATLASRWGIGIEQAKHTIAHTTHTGFRSVLYPSLSRRFRTNDRQLRYKRLPLVMYTDTLISGTHSRRGNKYAQVFCATNGWKRAFPMQKKSQAHEALSLLFQRDGVPSQLIMDGAREQTSGEFRKKARQAQVHCHEVEPHTPQSNFAETAIKELKNGAGRKMFRSRAPRRLWDDCLELEALIQSLTWNGRLQNGGEVPETVVSGETADISQVAQHEWYEWIMFRDTSIPFPDNKMVLGRYLGPSIDVGPALTAKILKANGEVVHRSTYRGLTDVEQVDEDICKRKQEFDVSVHLRLGTRFEVADLVEEDSETPTFDLYADEDGEEHHHCEDADEAVTPEAGDEYVHAEVSIQRGDQVQTGRVIGRKRQADGTLRGSRNENPLLDTRIYEVEFPDGEVTEYAANVIAENMWAQCDLDGQQRVLLDAIIDHKTDGQAVGFADRFVTVKGKQHLRKTTKGWHLCCQWKDGSTSWNRLADLKESNPIEVAEYAVARGIDHESAFLWWVPYTLKRRNWIIAAVGKRASVKQDFKFGIEVPKTVEGAIQLDRKNGNTLWQEAIRQEMAAVRIAFRILGPEEKIPPTYQKIDCHMIFTVKMENFRRKARFVAGGHTTEHQQL